MSSSRVFFLSTAVNFFGVVFLFLATVVAAAAGSAAITFWFNFAAAAGGAAITFWFNFLPGDFFFGETEAVKSSTWGFVLVDRDFLSWSRTRLLRLEGGVESRLVFFFAATLLVIAVGLIHSFLGLAAVACSLLLCSANGGVAVAVALAVAIAVTGLQSSSSYPTNPIAARPLVL